MTLEDEMTIDSHATKKFTVTIQAGRTKVIDFVILTRDKAMFEW